MMDCVSTVKRGNIRLKNHQNGIIFFIHNKLGINLSLLFSHAHYCYNSIDSRYLYFYFHIDKTEIIAILQILVMFTLILL